MTMTVDQILAKLESLSNADDVAGMARFGINTEKAYGIRIPVLRKMAKELGTSLVGYRDARGPHFGEHDR